MDSLYSRSEETIAQCLLSGIPLNRLVIALAIVTDEVLKTETIPHILRPGLLLRALQILREIENERKLLDMCIARFTPHTGCRAQSGALGELWELPLEHEWLCGDCGKPLYVIRDKDC